MIKSLRIDERLIHGQVAVTWCSALQIDSIVVANDKVAKDDIQIMSLKMAAPGFVRVAVKSVEDAITLLNDPRAAKKNILVLVNNPKDALQLVKQVSNIPFVNVGNFGMIAKEKDRQILATSFAINQKEYEICKEIVELKPESHYQMTPTLNPQKIQHLLENYK